MVASVRGRRGLRGLMTKLLNDDDPSTHKGIIFGATATPISIAGAFTTGIEISADGTTAISVTSGFSGTTGFSFAGTATDGILVSGVCGDGIHISGANTVSGLHISGDQATAILVDVDAALATGLSFSVDTTMTMTNGIAMSGAGTITKGILLDATAITTAIEISAGSMTDAILISGTTPVDGIQISSACSANAINISTAQAGSGLQIASTWALGFAAGAINIGGAGAVAFGSVADNVCVTRVDLTAQMGAIDQYVMGTYMSLATSGAGPGTSIQHGIWMGTYSKLTIEHDTTDAYSIRGRTTLSGAIEGNQFLGVMGQGEITAAATLDATGGVYGVYGTVDSSGSGTCNRQVAAGYFTLRSNNVNLAGEQSCVIADMGGAAYSDYGVLARCGNNNLAEALIGLRCTDSAVIPAGIQIDQVSGTITHLLDFSSVAGCISTQAADVAGDNTSHKIAIDIAGSTYYLAVWDAAWT